MPPEAYEFTSPGRITVGFVGRPGQRAFFLQASEGGQNISLKLEKEQVFALARGIDDILEQLELRELGHTTAEDEPPPSDLDLEEPIEPVFVIGQMGLVYDGVSRRIVLIAQELVEEEEGSTARFWATPGQMRALSRHAKEIVAQGRPICPLCGRPMDPEGHFCPDGNGHGTKVSED